MLKLNTKIVLNFIKTHWYGISMVFLFIVTLILFIIGSYVKIGGGPEKSNTFVPNKKNYMTDLSIGQDNGNISNKNYLYCPNDTEIIPMSDDVHNLNGDIAGTPPSAPFVQLCGQYPTDIQQTDIIVTDVKFKNFVVDNKGKLKPVETRCCDKEDDNCKFHPALVYNTDPLVDAIPPQGEICTPPESPPFKPNKCKGSDSCNRMGICISTDTWKSVRDGVVPGLKHGDIFISVQDSDKVQCPPGMSSDGINLHSKCRSGKNIFLCKK